MTADPSTNDKKSESRFLLTATVTLENKENIVKARTILDTGAAVSFMTEKTATTLKLKRTHNPIQVTGTTGDSHCKFSVSTTYIRMTNPMLVNPFISLFSPSYRPSRYLQTVKKSSTIHPSAPTKWPTQTSEEELTSCWASRIHCPCSPAKPSKSMASLPYQHNWDCVSLGHSYKPTLHLHSWQLSLPLTYKKTLDDFGSWIRCQKHPSGLLKTRQS